MSQQSHREKIVIQKDALYPSVHCSTVYNSQDMEATYMSINRWMDKAIVVHIYKGILLSHEKEAVWVSWTEVMNLACYIEWSKSEREKQTSYINTYIWNLEKWYWWTYLPGRNWHADVEKGFVDTAVEGENGMNLESIIEIHTFPCVK